jgi:uncharacterized RDD family membrane protein YckC
MPAGWYYASGDPAGTVRYWDGELWQGEPVPNPSMPTANASVAPGGYAGWWSRVAATLIDAVLVGLAVGAVGLFAALASSVSETLTWLILIVVGLPVLVACLMLLYWIPGITGQSPGRRVMGYAIVHERDGKPIGGGAFLGRQLVGSIVNQFCYIDYLWPLWDDRNQRIVDKMVSSVAVERPSGKILPIFPDGKPF